MSRRREIETIIGVDYSMSSPAICIASGKTKAEREMLKNNQLFFLTQEQKIELNPNPTTIGADLKIRGELRMAKALFKTDADRFDEISNFVLKNITKYSRETTLIVLEGYSYGSVGKTFEISENTGVLKHKLIVENGFREIQIVAPSSLKKFATGSGRADKSQMQEAFCKSHNIDPARLRGALNQKNNKTSWNPSSDLIDAYFLSKFPDAL